MLVSQITTFFKPIIFETICCHGEEIDNLIRKMVLVSHIRIILDSRETGFLCQEMSWDMVWDNSATITKI